MSETKKFLFFNRKAPYGTIYAWESLEVVLISAAFEQDVSLAFMDDGVYQLVKGQDTAGIGMKNFSPTYAALGDYEITKIYVEKESLEERGLTLDDLQHLVWEDEDEDYAEKDSIRLVSRAELGDVMAGPYENSNLNTASSIMKSDDILLLIEDGVYGAVKSGKASAMIAGQKVSVLGPDLAARGISEDKLADGVGVIDYAGFVDLVESNDKVQSWL